MADTPAERLEAIAAWWDDGFPGAFLAVTPFEPRLRQAFEQVLLAIPEDAFETFLDVSPTVIYQEGARASVFGYAVRSLPDVPRWLVVMYFAPTLPRSSDGALVNTVAHELAHVVLGHHRPDGPPGPNGEHEQAADELSASWGFTRRYSRAQLARLRTP